MNKKYGLLLRHEVGMFLSKEVHINAIGADAPGKCELEPLILRTVDDYEQAIHGGEVNVCP